MLANMPPPVTNPLTPNTDGLIISTRTRVLLIAVRQALIMTLGALEDYLDLERSIVPKHKRTNI